MSLTTYGFSVSAPRGIPRCTTRKKEGLEAAGARKHHKCPADNSDQLLPQCRTPLPELAHSSSTGPTHSAGSLLNPASKIPAASPSSPSHQLDHLYCLEPHKIIVPCTSTQSNKASRGCPRVAANCRVKNKHLTKLVIPTFILLLFDRISSSRRRLSPRLVLARRLRTPDPSARRSAAPRSPPRALISGPQW